MNINKVEKKEDMVVRVDIAHNSQVFSFTMRNGKVVLMSQWRFDGGEIFNVPRKVYQAMVGLAYTVFGKNKNTKRIRENQLKLF